MSNGTTNGLILVGATGLAAEIAEALEGQLPGGLGAITGIYDDDTRLRKNPLLGIKFLGMIGDLIDQPPQGARFVLCQGENPDREKLGEQLERLGLAGFTVQHPSACVSPRATIEAGAYLAAFTFVGPHAFIGRHAVVNASASVGHGARVEKYAQLSPGVRISRFCQIGAAAFLGSNAVVAPALSVGQRARVGAGSFVFRNVPEGKLVVGVPGKVVD
jgi:sugar O-acyltransferase (sialic acid O-acetyltransferase NeuD family)